jgi:hypothetical protein
VQPNGQLVVPKPDDVVIALMTKRFANPDLIGEAPGAGLADQAWPRGVT